MIVVDTSAVIELLTASAPHPDLLQRVSGDGDLHAPHLVDVEFLHALRGLVRSGQLTADRAADARTDFADLTIVRYPHQLLADRAWELRDNATAHDACFLALAELTDTPLVTCDAKLGRVADARARVEVFGRT